MSDSNELHAAVLSAADSDLIDALRAVLDLGEERPCYYVTEGITTPSTCNCWPHRTRRIVSDAFGLDREQNG